MLAGGDEGHVVNTASMAGLVAGPAAGVYQASKHAAVAISETLHHDLVLRGARVRVSVLCPGLVATNIGSCTRNRPAGAPPPPSDAAVVEDALRQSLPGGLAPAAVADLVLDAVRAGRFWVLAGPGTKDMVRVRAADILEDRAPTFQMFA